MVADPFPVTLAGPSSATSIIQHYDRAYGVAKPTLYSHFELKNFINCSLSPCYISTTLYYCQVDGNELEVSTLL